MTEHQFVEIIASALIQVLRAMNARYGLRLWILTRDERRQIKAAMSNDTGACARVLRDCMMEE